MKKCLIMLSGAFLALGISFGSVRAEADGSLGLTFVGDSGDFITYETGDVYANMAPGEARTQKITLTNNDYREMKFYIRAEYSNPLGEGSANGNIAYDISFSNNEEKFLDAQLGGVTRANMETLDQNYMLKTLQRGESITVDMAIKIDGDSMDNTYQNTQGNLNLIFSVEYEEKTPLEKVITTVKKIPVINKIIDTGDTTSMGLLLGVFAASLVGLILMIIQKLRKNKKERA